MTLTKTKKKSNSTIEEGIYSIRCDVCLADVEDYSDSGTLCRKHIDNVEDYSMGENTQRIKKRI